MCDIPYDLCGRQDGGQGPRAESNLVTITSAKCGRTRNLELCEGKDRSFVRGRIGVE